MTALEVIDDLLSRKLLDWTRDELEAARVCALKGNLSSDEESYWRKVHTRLQKTEIEHATPEDLARAQICKVFPLWAAQGPFQSGGASAAAMRNAIATVLPPREVDRMADGLLRHAVSYDSDPTEWEKTRRTWAKTESSFTGKQALIYLRYAPGIVIETLIALWLLSNYSDWWVVCLACLMILASAAMTIAGLIWYWRWFAQRSLGAWYFTIAPFPIGIGLLIVTSRFQWINALNAIGHEWLAALFVVVISVFIVPLPVYCARRLLKFTLVRLFRVLLIAVSQAGSAWRGELRH